MRLEAEEGKLAGQVQYSPHLSLQMWWGRKELSSLDTHLSPFLSWPIPTPLLQSCGYLHGATMLVQGHSFQALAVHSYWGLWGANPRHLCVSQASLQALHWGVRPGPVTLKNLNSARLPVQGILCLLKTF